MFKQDNVFFVIRGTLVSIGWILRHSTHTSVMMLNVSALNELAHHVLVLHRSSCLYGTCCLGGMSYSIGFLRFCKQVSFIPFSGPPT